MLDIKAVQEEARKQVADETAAKAKSALVKKYRDLALAEQIVRNIKREVADLEASIADGSFYG